MKNKYKLVDFINRFVKEENMNAVIYFNEDINKISYDLDLKAYRSLDLFEDNGIKALVCRNAKHELFDISADTYEKVLDNLLNLVLKEVFAPLRTECSERWCLLFTKYNKHYKY